MIEILSLIAINLIWNIYSLTEGIREGHFKHFENLKRRKCETNINNLFKLQRFIVISLLSASAYYIFNSFDVILITIGLFFNFSFFHNGSYHCTRRSLDSENYKLGFMDGETLNMYSTLRNWRERVLFFIIGSSIQTFLYIFLT